MLENKSPVKKVKQGGEDKSSQQQKKQFSQASLRDFNIGSNKGEPVTTLPVQPVQSGTQPTKAPGNMDLSSMLKKSLGLKPDHLERQASKELSGKRAKKKKAADKKAKKAQEEQEEPKENEQEDQLMQDLQNPPLLQD